MKISRRRFLCGASALSLVIANPRLADAAIHGGPTAAPNNNARVTLNVELQDGFANIAKGFGFQASPTNQDSNGYPITSPNPAIVAGSSPNMPANYFSQFVWKWSGIGSMYINSAPPFIVSASSSNSGTVPSVGDNAGGNTALTNVDTPRLVFLFGINIQSITQSPVSNGAGGNLIRIGTKTGFAVNLVTGDTTNISGITTQTNANGTWLITVIDAQTFDLQASTWSAGQGAGGAVGQAILQGQNLSIFIGNFLSPGSGTWTFSNLVWCKSANETAVANGAITEPTLLAQFQYLQNPNGLSSPNVWLRFMDFSGAQQSWEADFSQRVTPANLCYFAQNFRTGYWVGAVTNGGSDNYTCADPGTSGGIQVWNGTNYIDNGIVQGNVNATNTGGFPTLAVGGGPAKPIFNYFAGISAFNYFAPSVASAAGQVLQFTFSASWLNGGSPHVVSYTTTTSGPNGNDTTSTTALTLNLASAFQADAILAAGNFVYGFNGQSVSLTLRTAQAGRMSFSQTSGATSITIETTAPAAVATGNSSFMYNYLLDGWVYRSGGIVMSTPLEQATEICNACNAHLWWNWGTTKGGFVSGVANFFATNLTSGLRLGQEPGNEVWNAAAFPFSFWNTLGFALGFPNGSDAAVYSYAALRISQYNALAKTAWTGAGASASNLWVLQPSAAFDVSVGGNFDFAQMRGNFLNRSGGTVNGIANNPIYASYGGLNGSGGSTAPVSINYNIAPNRPVDITNATGCAPYWSSLWLGNGGSIASSANITGTVTQNAPWLQAANSYASGSPVAAFTSMVDQFTEVTSGGSGNNGYDFVSMQGTFTSQEALCAQYDGARPSGMSNLIIMDYECGPSWAVGSNGINGINSVNSGDIAAIAAQMTSLGWNVSPYTISGTNNTTEMATMAVELFQGWKLDTDINGNALNTGSYKNMIKTNYYAARNKQNTGREAHAAQFSYGGPSQWCLFPGDYNGTAYTSFAGMHEFNS